MNKPLENLKAFSRHMNAAVLSADKCTDGMNERQLMLWQRTVGKDLARVQTALTKIMTRPKSKV